MSVETKGVRIVPTYCYQCVAGPDLLTVKVEDGVATEVEPNFCAADIHPGGGKVCVKAYGLVQKTYNPHRVRTPMKRSNPLKGRDQDPGFVPISWEEAFGLIEEKLNAVRANGILDAIKAIVATELQVRSIVKSVLCTVTDTLTPKLFPCPPTARA